MTLSKALLKIIVCPKCKGELEYKSNENKLICNGCRLSFRVEDEIPVLLIEEAESI
ncbi:MAG: Trm112 family protein [Candidatus Zixiibacteriota bacterium]|nr:MAG: Trm112 family protein [candidate division Zixibacteria bacterium]HDL04113.1 Trm112 family protein [candidate division Zixibacteria bacterium]